MTGVEARAAHATARERVVFIGDLNTFNSRSPSVEDP
jgi:hypothetical protein